eukprot:scaffold1.g5808.t1
MRWFLLLALAASLSSAQNTYDPCQPITPLQRGSPFVFGLAFYPGGTIANWGLPETIQLNNTQAGLTGPNPCLQAFNVNGTTVNYTQYLEERNVVFATYAIQVDVMAALRTVRAEFDQMWNDIPLTQKRVVSVVAFRNNVRSEARYVRSSDPKETGGTGVVESMALEAVFDNGVLQARAGRGHVRGAGVYFQWYDFGCSGCASAECLQTQYNDATQQYPMETCATPFSNCYCNKTNPLDCPSNNCTSTIYTGFRGTSASGKPLLTAYQIEDVNKYSISGAFKSFSNFFQDLFSNLGGSTTSGTTGGASSYTVLPAGNEATGADLAAAQNAQATVGFVAP